MTSSVSENKRFAKSSGLSQKGRAFAALAPRSIPTVAAQANDAEERYGAS